MAPILATLAVPSHTDEIILSLPAPHTLLLTLNRPQALNAVSPQLTDSIDRILNWAEQEGDIWWVNFCVDGVRRSVPVRNAARPHSNEF